MSKVKVILEDSYGHAVVFELQDAEIEHNKKIAMMSLKSGSMSLANESPETLTIHGIIKSKSICK